MKKNKHFQPQFDFCALPSLNDNSSDLQILVVVDPVQPVFGDTSSSIAIEEIDHGAKDINMEPEPNKKSTKPKRIQAKVISVVDQETKVINSNGDITVISYEIVKANEIKNYVVRVRREYADGSLYVEPDRFWQSLSLCKIDMKDWTALGKLSDW